MFMRPTPRARYLRGDPIPPWDKATLSKTDPTVSSDHDVPDEAIMREELVDVLSKVMEAMRKEVSREGLSRTRQQRQKSFEEDHLPTVDEQLQNAGAEIFNEFEGRMMTLDKELRQFANTARQLGSSARILSSSLQLRGCLARILFLFRENAADLFPLKVQRQSRELLSKVALPQPRQGHHHAHTSRHYRVPGAVEKDQLDIEDFPFQLQLLQNDVTTFLERLNEFPEYKDEPIDAAIQSLANDLTYWASCLRAYRGQLRTPAVQQFLNDMSVDLGDHIDIVTSSLSVYTEIGVPTIQSSQRHASQNILNLSTVATVFSAVTATTLQFSFTDVKTPLANAVNSFWFISLVLSIGAAVNSLLGVTWKHDMHRPPKNRVPWWVLMWIRGTPLAFFGMSATCFSIGLVLFAFSSGQNSITRILTTVFSACSVVGVMAVSIWFSLERAGISWYDCTNWVTVIMHRMAIGLRSIWSRTLVHVDGPRTYIVGPLRRTRISASRLNIGPPHVRYWDPESAAPGPVSPQDEFWSIWSEGSPPPPLHTMSSSSGKPASRSDIENDNGTGDSPSDEINNNGNQGGAHDTGRGKARFVNAVKAVIQMRAVSRAFRERGYDRLHTQANTMPVEMLKKTRTLVPALRSMYPKQSLEEHSGLVKCIQFSPDGQYMVTSSWDRSLVIFNVGETFTRHKTLWHITGFVNQVAWSPNGKLLLTKTNHGVKVWAAETGELRQTIDRPETIQSVSWLPDNEGFLSVEKGSIVHVDVAGNECEQYVLEGMVLHDIALMEDNTRLVCVGTLVASPNRPGIQPDKCRPEKRIFVYNMKEQNIESRVPVLHEVRDITLGCRDQAALVSYESKASPQLWKLDRVTDSVRLSLRHVYMPTPRLTVEFSGPSYFGGENDELVLCAGKYGDIHIWDRESAALLRYIPSSMYFERELTCIAWNRAWKTFMFATGNHDGMMEIWTPPADTSELTNNISGPGAEIVADAGHGSTLDASTSSHSAAVEETV